MHVVTRSVVVALAVLIVTTSTAHAQTPDEVSETDAFAAGQRASVSASYKRRVESVEFGTKAVTQQLSSAAETAAGSPAAGGMGSRAYSSSTLPGCYNHVLAAVDGQMRYGHICPGYGGYQGGAAAELFGVHEIVLRDPVTGAITGTIPADELTGAPATTVTVTSAQLAEFAFADLTLPTPAVSMNPEGDQLVQLPSWLWIEPTQWVEEQRTATAGPISATVTADPARVEWDMGDGEVVTCDGPGRVYERRFAERPDATDCLYTYRHSSSTQPDHAYPMTATIAWDVSWTGSDGDGGGFGELTSTTSRAVRVREAQALVQ